jgi:MFS family permease
VGLAFGRILLKTKGMALPLALLLSAAALFIIRFSPNQHVLLVGSVCFGIGTSLITPALYSMLYKKVGRDDIVASVALLGVAGNVSQFVSPLLINPISALVNRNGSIEGTRLLLAAFLVIALLIVLTILYHKGKKGRSD